jgi:hypothetical protein
MSIAQQALSWPEIRRLTSVPGVNLICAAPFIAAIGRANRFMTSRKPVAYLGLDPKVPQSGQARPAPAGCPNADRRPPGGRWWKPPGDQRRRAGIHAPKLELGCQGETSYQRLVQGQLAGPRAGKVGARHRSAHTFKSLKRGHKPRGRPGS